MRLLKVEAGREAYEKEIENSLSSIQAELGGGLFQPVYTADGIILCCNEEGKLNGMEMNRRIDGDKSVRVNLVCFLIMGNVKMSVTLSAMGARIHTPIMCSSI